MRIGDREMIESYWMPAEFEPHDATWLGWPGNAADFPGVFEVARAQIARMAALISTDEPVRLVLPDKASAKLALGAIGAWRFARLDRIEPIIVRTDRNWHRDSGPIFVFAKDGSKRVLDAHFNGWARYPNHSEDARLCARMALRLGLRQVDARIGALRRPMTLEGGAFDLNGSGSALVTRECLLSSGRLERNRGATESDYAAAFERFLGVSKIIWLAGGLQGDDTNGHIDNVARFIARDHILHAYTSDRSDRNYAMLEANRAILSEARLEDGSRLKLTPMPLAPERRWEGGILPVSYLNFYIANGMIIAPTFGDSNDTIALRTLRAVARSRKIEPIESNELALGGGGPHCLTQQEPRAQARSIAN